MQEKAKQFSEQGFAILPAMLSSAEILHLNSILDRYRQSTMPSSSSAEIFAVRNLLQTIPELAEVLKISIVPQLAEIFAGNKPSIIRSIYFNKPATANWVVPWHQDLTVNLKEKSSTNGFTKWAVKDGQLTAKAPAELLSKILTLRIHLDDCDETNGALKVIPGSHLHGELRTDDYLRTELERAVTCSVNSGGIMLMQPLLLHASSRSKGAERRVIHLEFYSGELPAPLQWSEAIKL
jgi:ectoine hydroxylase-related dioxygenase (phytanoyl-CoA dioxygenase family)